MIDIDLAEDMTRGEFERALKNEPDRLDFSFFPTMGGKTYIITWSKDLNVSNPKWHIGVQEYIP